MGYWLVYDKVLSPCLSLGCLSRGPLLPGTVYHFEKDCCGTAALHLTYPLSTLSETTTPPECSFLFFVALFPISNLASCPGSSVPFWHPWEQQWWRPQPLVSSLKQAWGFRYFYKGISVYVLKLVSLLHTAFHQITTVKQYHMKKEKPKPELSSGFSDNHRVVGEQLYKA